MHATPPRFTAATLPGPRVVKLLGADARTARNDEDAPGVGRNSRVYRAFVDLADARDERNAALASEQELIEADRLRNVDKAATLAERSDAEALALQVHMLRCAGGL